MIELASPQVEEKVTCFHCGEPCAEESSVFDGKHFCCQGCQTVYQVFSENGLTDYYSMDQRPGISLKGVTDEGQYTFLEHPDIQKKLLDFHSETLSRLRFFIPAIHCSSCIWLLENLYRLHSGIKEVRVNFGKREASVSFHPGQITLRQVAELLHSIGYSPNIHLAHGEKQKKLSQRIGMKIGVAGFAFGNIMLLSFPEYLGIEDMSEGLAQVFSYLNIVLALPVLLYCSQDYFSSAWKSLKQRFVNIDVPIAIGILVLFFRSTYEIISHTGAGYMDSLAGLLFFLLIGRWFQSRTYESLSFDRDYKSYFPLAVTRLRAGQEETVPVQELVAGDEILIRSQEIIPADAVLLSESASIDYSFVTGESDLQQMKKGDYLYAGGRQVGGRVGMLVQKPTNHSYLTGLWNHEAFGKPYEQKSRRTIDKISRHFTVIILSIALGAGVFWTLVDSTNVWQTVTAVLIVACPCALAMSTPFTNGNVLRVLGRHGLYLKNADVVERMAEVDMLVFDKTGTITLPDGGQVKFVGEATTDELGVMGQLAANSTHPLSKKIHRLTSSLSSMKSVKKFSEIPGQGIEAWVEGREYRLGSSAFVTGRYAEDAEGTTRVYVAIDGENRGHFEVEASFREGLEDLLDKLSGNYQWMVVSGDNEADKASLEKLFPENTPMLFNRKPEQKLKLIEDLQKEGHKVMMLGDGLNDAGALKISHVGFAVSDDTSAFSPACDGILYGPQLYHLDKFLAMAKGGKKVLLSSFGLSFLYNVVGLSFAVSAKLTPIFAAILMPLSSITIVAFATVSVHLLGKTKNL